MKLLYITVSLKKESIHRFVQRNPDKTPHTANNKLPENQTEEKRNKFAMQIHSALLQNNPLDNRTDKD